MKRSVFVILMLIVATALFAQTATVQEFSGRVEYRLSAADAWTAIRAGLQIPLNATVSTGFNSRAVLVVNGSVIEVAALTRLTIEELAADASGTSTGVFVPVGRVRATVDRDERLSTDFRVRTAQSTAAVRGTSFETNGWQLSVSEGIVEFANLLGQSRAIGATEISVITDEGPTDPLSELNNQANLGDADFPDGQLPTGPAGFITVRWGN